MKENILHRLEQKRFYIILVTTLASIILIIYLMNMAWKISGSNKWELEFEKEHIKIYSFKEPGSYVKRFRAVKQGSYSLNHIVASLTIDNYNVKNCLDWIPGCVDQKQIEAFSENSQGDVILSTIELPGLFKTREYLIKSYVLQDPETKKVSVDIAAITNKVDLSSCCIRPKHIHNRWEISPIKPGLVEIQLTQDFNLGGLFPMFLVNISLGNETYKLFNEKLPKLLDKDKYRSKKFDFIEEMDNIL